MKKWYVFYDNKISDRVLENHPLTKENKIHTFKWMRLLVKDCPEAGFVPRIMSIEVGLEMMLISVTVFLLVFWVCGLSYKDHLGVKEGFPSKHKFSSHQCQVLLNVAFLDKSVTKHHSLYQIKWKPIMQWYSIAQL